MVNVDPVDLVLEYGPEGNVDNGRNCSVYELEDGFVKLSDRLEEPEGEYFTKVLDEAGIAYPKTEFYTDHVSLYNMGDILVVEQNKAEPALSTLMENPEQYVNRIRKIGLKAAGHDLKLDIGLENLCFIEDQIGTFDINDPESVWTEEPLALHLMGSHLLNSVRHLKKHEGLYAPELEELARNWKKSV